MGVVHRTIFTWFTILVFLILLVLRVDNRTQWNWFVVFIPVWIFNAILLIYAVFRTTSDCKNRADHARPQAFKNANVVLGVILMMAFEIMLCMKLEYPTMNIPLAYVMIPLWIILPILIIRVFMALFNHSVVVLM